MSSRGCVSSLCVLWFYPAVLLFCVSLTGGDVSLSSSQCSLNAISMVEWADKVLRCVMQAMHDEKNKTAGRQ